MRGTSIRKIEKSHLLQMRGLKQIRHRIKRRDRRVASFTDAWIETPKKWSIKLSDIVASFTDAWIETKRNMVTKKQILGRIFYRCVD